MSLKGNLMSAKIINFAEKKRDRQLKQILNMDINQLTDEELDSLMKRLYRIILENAEESYPSSIEGHTTVMINGMAYIIPTISNDS